MATPGGDATSPELHKRQTTRTCDSIYAAYLAGTKMTSQDYKDWTAWSCRTWFPSGIGATTTRTKTTSKTITTTVRTCDSIYAAYRAGTKMTAKDYSDWKAWSCATWFPLGIGATTTKVTTSKTRTTSKTTTARTCDSIYASYVAGTKLTAKDYSDWQGYYYESDYLENSNLYQGYHFENSNVHQGDHLENSNLYKGHHFENGDCNQADHFENRNLCEGDDLQNRDCHQGDHFENRNRYEGDYFQNRDCHEGDHIENSNRYQGYYIQNRNCDESHYVEDLDFKQGHDNQVPDPDEIVGYHYFKSTDRLAALTVHVPSLTQLLPLYRSSTKTATSTKVTTTKVTTTKFTTTKKQTSTKTSSRTTTSTTYTHVANYPLNVPPWAIVVAKDGSGQFTDIQSAVDSIPAHNKVEKVIYIKAGLYDTSQIWINNTYITLVGDGIGKTIISYGLNKPLYEAMNPGTTSGSFESATVKVRGKFFKAFDITFQNTAPTNASGVQAPAFYMHADNMYIENCAFYSWQDTLLDYKGTNHWYKNIYVFGDVDFVWGYGRSIFQNSEFHVGNRPMRVNGTVKSSKGYVVANGAKPGGSKANSWFWIYNSSISADPNTDVYLARPWGTLAAATFQNVYMPSSVLPVGYINMSSFYPKDTNYWEVNATNTGPGADTSKRAPYVHQTNHNLTFSEFFTTDTTWLTSVTKYGASVDQGAGYFQRCCTYFAPPVVGVPVADYPDNVLSNAIVVAKDGSGNFTSVQAAIDSVPNPNAAEQVIYIKAGNYSDSQIEINTDYITLVGDGMNATTISYYLNNRASFESATVKVRARYFKAFDIRFENTAPTNTTQAQAPAFYVNGDNSYVENCAFYSWQDTLLSYKGTNQVFNNCYIFGDVDFIWGYGRAMFVNSEFHVGNRALRLSGSNAAWKGYVVASGANDGTYANSAFWLVNSSISADNGVNVYLGRPWGNRPAATFQGIFMPGSVDPTGFIPMSTAPATTEYYEVNTTNTGPGADTSQRVSWVHQTSKGLTFDAFFTSGTSWLKSVSKYGASVKQGSGYFQRCCSGNYTDPSTIPATTVTGYPANVLSNAIVVALDGSGNFTSIQAAIDSVTVTNKEQVIYIKAGSYAGSQVTITKNYITLVGDGIGRTIITNKYNNPMWAADHPGQSGASAYCATVRVTASYFKAFDLTFENTATSDQAPAFYIQGNNLYIENVAFLSWQDTLLSWTGSNQVFNNCYIRGDVDFIWGYGRAVFQNCQFHVGNRPLTLYGTNTDWWGSVVANGATPTSYSTSCFWMYNSTISSDVRTTAYLGRNWGTLPCAYFQSVIMPASVPAVGYSAMTSGNISTNYFEVQGTNTGLGSNSSGRISWAHITSKGFSSIDDYFGSDTTWLRSVTKFGSSVNKTDGYFMRLMTDTPIAVTRTTTIKASYTTTSMSTTTTIPAPSWYPVNVPYNAIVVSQTGNGQYTSIQAALNSVSSSNNAEVVIYIVAGTYTVSSSITVSRNFITLVGDGINSTIISSSLTGLANGTIYVTGTNFKAFDITFENTVSSGQAPAFIVQANDVYLENCAIQGWTSPIYAWTGSNQWFYNCYIRGDGDIIIGNSRALFDSCEIHVGNKKIQLSGQNSAVTGSIATNGNNAEPSATTSSFWIYNSSISGRAWYPYSSVIYQSVYMPASVPSVGWTVVSPVTQSQLYEVNTTNYGPGSNTSGRVYWARQASTGLTFGDFFATLDTTSNAQFTSIQAALDSVSLTNGAEVVIYISSGTYVVSSTITVSKNYITLVGDGINKTIISSGISGLAAGTVAVTGDFFKAFDLTFDNSVSSGQAPALVVRGTNVYIENSAVQGWQSPLYAWSGTNQWFYNCIIRGDGDMIIGNSRALFQNSELHIGNKNIQLSNTYSGGTGHVATNGNNVQPTSATSSFWIYNSSISADPLMTAYLGRAWFNYSSVVYQSVYMPINVPAAGWTIVNAVTQSQLYEVNTTNLGPGASTAGRVSWANQISTGLTFSQFFTGDTTWLLGVNKYGSSINRDAGYFVRCCVGDSASSQSSTSVTTSSSDATPSTTVTDATSTTTVEVTSTSTVTDATTTPVPTTTSLPLSLPAGVPNTAITVSQAGNGQYSSIQAALDSVSPSNSAEVIIYIASGKYVTASMITVTKGYITLVGDGINKTIISSALGGSLSTGTVVVTGTNFKAFDITFENTVLSGQAPALGLRASNAYIENVAVQGWQSSLYLGSATNQWFYNCIIRGDSDMIIGNGRTLFQNSELHIGNKQIQVNGVYNGITGHVATNGANSATSPSSFWFLDSSISADPLTTVYLGRAWYNYSSVIYQSVYMPSNVPAVGWTIVSPVVQSQLVEVNTTNYGPGSNTSGRVSWVNQASTGLTFEQFFTGDTTWLKSVAKYGASVSKGIGYFSRCCVGE
ncbi:hypothetical protein HDU93_009166 [Gonapodya sp. JEL0774]|nr:hypothetical protein HDU93_009166 [Gonapodya sp. JEL0774]